MYVELMKKEFMYIKQGIMSVMEYEHEFVKLSCYAKNIIQTEKEMCNKFE